ncbi:MAG: hypothetical protein ACO2O1_03130 [Candidatus Caldarchaeales archaeon]|jgi:hypothetical protein
MNRPDYIKSGVTERSGQVANNSVLFVLTRGNPEDKERLLSSLRNDVEGAKHACFVSENAVRLDVSRGTDFTVSIRPEEPRAVERLVTTYLNDWYERAPTEEVNSLIGRVYRCVGPARSDRIPQHVVAEILPSISVLPFANKPMELCQQILRWDDEKKERAEKGRFIVLYRCWGRKARTPGIGASVVAIFSKDVDVEGFCYVLNLLLDKLAYKHSYNVGEAEKP